jgi:threonine aldolase
MIDFRSDTVTRPSKMMLEAMQAAPVGDDVFGDDPTINKLEQMAAELFGMEAALFCPSGTMTNQIAIKVHTQAGDEVICDRLSHIYNYEGGGIAQNSGASVKLLAGDRGRVTAAQVADAINPDDVHFAHSSLVSLENTCNKGGGSIYNFADMQAISVLCMENNLALHLDGARLFNALVETTQTAKDYGQIFDSISICLSKGLGCPVGSLLLGSNAFMKKARRTRKVFGGSMRQAGYLAAAGIYALENNIDRLLEDHRRANVIGDMVKKSQHVVSVMPIETNIVIFELAPQLKPAAFIAELAKFDIHVTGFGGQLIRIVTHLDISENMLNVLEDALAKVSL